MWFRALTIILCYTVLAQAQDKTIRGRVLDEKGNPIFLANISVLKSSKGTHSNAQGVFKLKVANQDNLIVSAMGYATKTISVKDWNFDLPIKLTSKQVKLENVLLSATRPIAENFEVSQMSAIDIYKVPGSNADPLRASVLQSYATNNSESALPELRGSAPARSQVIFNNAPLRNPVRGANINTGIGFYSILNTELIKSLFTFPSNPPLIFGNSSGGLIQIETVDRLSESQTQFSLGLLHASVLTKQQLSEKKNFLIAYSNYQHSSLYLKLNDAAALPSVRAFRNVDLGMLLQLQPTRDLTIKYFGYGIDETFGGTTSNLNTTQNISSESQRTFHILNIDHKLWGGNLSWNNRFDYQEQNTAVGNYEGKNKIPDYYTDLSYKYQSKFMGFQTGINYNHSQIQVSAWVPKFFYALRDTDPNFHLKYTKVRRDVSTYSFLKAKISDWYFSIGFRSTYPADLPGVASYYSYQGSINWNIIEGNRLLLGAGKYHSYANFSDWVSGDQVALDYSLQLGTTAVTSGLYYKRESADATPISLYTTPSSRVVMTHVWGLEASWSGEVFKNWKFNLSNTLLYRKQTLRFEEQQYLNPYTWSYYPKASLSYNKGLWSGSINTIAATGGTYTPIQSTNPMSPIPNTPIPMYAHPDHMKRYPYFMSVNLNVSKFFLLGENRILVHASVNNLLNRKNFNKVYYSRDYTQTFFEQGGSGRVFYMGVVWYL